MKRYKRLFFVIFFISLLFYCGCLSVKIHEYINLKEENKILNKDLKKALDNKNYYVENLDMLNDQLETMKQEKKVYIEEYQKWEKWNQEVKEYLK